MSQMWLFLAQNEVFLLSRDDDGGVLHHLHEGQGGVALRHLLQLRGPLRLGHGFEPLSFLNSTIFV